MASADYRCRECGGVYERTTDDYPDGLQEVIDSYCDLAGTTARMDRVWTAPHMGRMSSGEPPR